ncbi:putative methyl-accepting chemotaxis protein, partial [Operophtera brumata]
MAVVCSDVMILNEKKRPGNLRLSLMSNTVFILCIFLVAVVTCVFRLNHFFEQAANIALVIMLLLAGA